MSDQLDRIQARFFYVLCDTDEFYPADFGADITETMQDAGVNITFHRVSSHNGPYAYRRIDRIRRFYSCLLHFLCTSMPEAAEEFRSTIKLIRHVALKKDIFILAGGKAFLSDPLLAQDVGADAIAADAGIALATATAA